MTQINLLPWREQKREYERKLFTVVMGIAVAVSVIIVFLINSYAENQVSNQTARNQMLQREIALYDLQIKEINSMEKIKAKLITRMTVVRNFQATRMLMVHLFDELIKITPSGVFITHIEGKNNQITLLGFAQSNTCVSQAMKNIENNEWIHNPVLNEIKKMDDKKQPEDNEFKLIFTLEPQLVAGKS